MVATVVAIGLATIALVGALRARGGDVLAGRISWGAVAGALGVALLVEPPFLESNHADDFRRGWHLLVAGGVGGPVLAAILLRATRSRVAAVLPLLLGLPVTAFGGFVAYTMWAEAQPIDVTGILTPVGTDVGEQVDPALGGAGRVVAPAPVSWPPIPAELGELYVDKGVCPGECCTYREWTATAEVDVVAAPNSATVVARLAKGEPLTAETGEVHVKPVPARVLVANADAPGIAPGAILWLLTPTGEGWSNVWVDGKTRSLPTMFRYDESCATRVDEDCWATPASLTTELDPWWVRVKTGSGVTGWVDNTRDVLTGFDACG